MKLIPHIKEGARVALPCCPKAVVIGIDLGTDDASSKTWMRARPDGSLEILHVETVVAVPILGTIGERAAQ
ncbi:hypothetical protein [Shinella pollutisoli]|uniref:Uncharacterized protein n=1 Tax=Shinella pollutisoli TaxID=2250594 RepID=A0ABV7DKK4_9HYPH|nr:hypothetical protein [Shinella pollutisoli]